MWYKQEHRVALLSDYPQVKVFAKNRLIRVDNSSVKALHK